MRRDLALWLAAFLLAPEPPAAGLLAQEPTLAGVRVLYGPGGGFDGVDARLIGGAKRAIDLAAYVLTDRDVAAALQRAAAHGVKVRVYLDSEDGRVSAPLRDLAATPNVELRVKHPSRDLMHLKSYQVDGHVLRSGSANFSFSAGAYQDNDIIVIQSPLAAGRFRATFEKLWMRSDNHQVGPR